MADRVKRGIAWVTISTIIRNIISLAQISILARILDKADFGIMAIAMLFVNFTQLFMDMGVSAGIIHIQKITQKEYSSLYWFNVFFGLALTTILLLITPVISSLYNSEILRDVIYILCLSVFITSIGNQQRIVCQKLTHFKRLAILDILTSMLSIFTSTSLALQGYGVFSLAIAALAGTFFNNVSHLVIGLKFDNKIKFHFVIDEVKPFLKIGIYSVGSKILDFATREMDVMIISATLGLDFLGIYNLAKRISLAIYNFVTPAISTVFTPLFAEINTNKDKLYDGYIKLIKSISVMSLPLFSLIAILSPTIMLIVFGKNFIEGAPVQSVFAIMYAFNSFLSVCSSLQVATGRTDIGLKWTILSVIATAIIFYTSSLYGITIFLFGILLRIFIDVIGIWYIQLKPMIHIRLSDYIAIFKIPFFICFGLSIPVFIFFYYPSLILSIVIGVLFSSIYLFLLSLSNYRPFLIYIYNRIKQ